MPEAPAVVGARPTSSTVVVRVRRLLDTNKAKVAAATPFIITLVGVGLNLIFTGEWDQGETKLAVLGLVTTLLTGGAVYQVPTEKAEVENPPAAASAPGVPGIV